MHVTYDPITLELWPKWFLGIGEMHFRPRLFSIVVPYATATPLLPTHISALGPCLILGRTSTYSTRKVLWCVPIGENDVQHGTMISVDAQLRMIAQDENQQVAR